MSIKEKRELLNTIKKLPQEKQIWLSGVAEGLSFVPESKPDDKPAGEKPAADKPA